MGNMELERNTNSSIFLSRTDEETKGYDTQMYLLSLK